TQLATNVVRYPMRQHFKARFPALNVARLREIFATDTFFASTPALGGVKMVQLYVGKTSYFTAIYGMHRETQMPSTLQTFIREWGAPSGLLSDNAKVETESAVGDILNMYSIKDMQTEPHHPNQNPAERRIKEVKSTTNILMDRTGTPEALWLLCMHYVVYLLNRLAAPTLEQRTPMEVAFGVTPDISALLEFHWYEPVYYYDPNVPFPTSKEKSGHFVGIAENVGDALTFKLITDETNQVICRSVVRSATNKFTPNQRLDEEIKDLFECYSDRIEDTQLKLPTVDPASLIGFQFIRDYRGDKFRAKVKCPVSDDKFLVELGDGQREEIMAYNELIQLVDQQLTDEPDDGEKLWTYKKVQNHRKVKN
ncbi:MAG: hypothetical protein ACRDL7_12945, partial [Gaiellaceae bacterium]